MEKKNGDNTFIVTISSTYIMLLTKKNTNKVTNHINTDQMQEKSIEVQDSYYACQIPQELTKIVKV
jgi:hypothetical protein